MAFTAEDKSNPVFKAVIDYFRQIEQATGVANKELIRLNESSLGLAGGFGKAATEADKTKAQVAAQVKEYENAARGLELYAHAETQLQTTQAALTGTNQGAISDLQGLEDGISQAQKAMSEFQAVIDRTPKGIKELSAQAKNSEKALKDEARARTEAADSIKTSVNAQVRAYEQAAAGLEKYRRTEENLSKQMASGIDGNGAVIHDVQALEDAMVMADKSARDYQKIIDSLPPGIKELALQLRAEQKAIDDERRATEEAEKAKKKLLTAQESATANTLSFVRGLASSVFHFSLLAGSIVAAGHLLGNFFNQALTDSDKLQKSIDDLSSLAPTIDTAPLYDQFRMLEEQTGVLSDKITAVYSRAAQAARGNAPDTAALTETLIGGAQGGRQDPDAWATAVIGAMNAYEKKVADVAHIQDVLTLAIQNSYGAGKVLTDRFAELAQNGAQVHASLETVAAMYDTVAKHGGDAGKNVDSVRAVFAAMATSPVIDMLHQMGIATADASGNALDLSQVLDQLEKKLAGLTTTARDKIIANVIPDRDAQAALKILLGDMATVTKLQQDFTDSVGASKKAQDTFLDTATAKMERIKALQQSWAEWLGNLANIPKHVAEAIVDVQNINDGMDAMERFGKARDALVESNPEAWKQFQATMRFDEVGHLQDKFADLAPRLDEFVGRLQAAGAAGKEMTPALIEGILKYMAELYKLPALHKQSFDSAYEMAKAFGHVKQATAETTPEVQKAEDAYTQWAGKVLDSSSYLQASLTGVSEAVNKVYRESASLLSENSFGQFATAAERDLAQTIAKIEELNTKVRFLRSLSSGSYPGQQGQLDSSQAELRKLLADAEAQTLAIQRASPKAAEAQIKFADFTEQVAGTERMDAAQQHLTNVTEEYNRQLTALKDTQREYQNQLRDDSTPELAAAKQDLADKTEHLANVTRHYDNELQMLSNALDQTRTSAKGVLDPLAESLQKAQAALDAFNTGAEQVNTILRDDLFALVAAQKQVQAESVVFLQPLIDAAEKAKNAVAAITEATQAKDEEFANTAYLINENLKRLDALYKPRMDPLKQDIADLNAALEESRQKEAEALQPIQDAIYAQSEALREAQAEVKRLAAHYAAELVPLQAEYNALKREEARQAEQDKLHAEQLTVENLSARLAQARVGSGEFLSLQEQLAKAKNQQGRDVRLDALGQQIQGIEDERDAALAAAKERQDAEAELLAQLQLKEQQVKRQFELDRRADEATLRDKKAELAQEEANYNRFKAIYQARLEAVRNEQEEYDHAQHLKELDAAATLKLADANLASARTSRKVLEDSAAYAVAAQNELITNTEHAQEVARRQYTATVGVAKKAYDDQKKYWDDLIGLIGDKITATQKDATEFEKAAKADVKTADEQYKLVREAIQKNIDKIGDQIIALGKTATEAEATATRFVKAEQQKQTELAKTIAMQNALNDLVKNGGVLPAGFVLPDGTHLPTGYTPPAGEPAGPPPGGDKAPPGHPAGLPLEQPVGAFKVTGSTDYGLTPVPTKTMQSFGGGGGGGAFSINTLHVDLSGAGSAALLGPGDPTDDKHWDKVAEAIHRSTQRVLRTKYGKQIGLDGA